MVESSPKSNSDRSIDESLESEQVEEEIKTEKKDPAVDRLTTSRDMMNEIFSFLPGYIVIHKVAIISKGIRQLLKDKKDLVTGRFITLKINGTQTGHFDAWEIPNDQWERRFCLNLSKLRKFLPFTNGVKIVISDSNYTNALSFIEML